MEGLPQKFDAGELVSYRDEEDTQVDGIVIATVTCHEQYVVGPGEQRDKNPGPMFMLCAHRIVPRGQTPLTRQELKDTPLPAKPE